MTNLHAISKIDARQLPAMKSPPANGEERSAFMALDPAGFLLRSPPRPHMLSDFITSDDDLFQTIHMGAAVVDANRWQLVVDGLVEHPFALDLAMLRGMPKTTITSFHECFGSPLKPATQALWRVGNVAWTGVRLNHIIGLARPLADSRFVWSEGLDRGTFAGITVDRYQKDLPLEKALAGEVLLAYEINGQPLSKERGGPVRLVVPGFFGTNSTKWISKLTLSQHRATGPYTTTLYNEPDMNGPSGASRPVWQVEVNSMITCPKPDAVIHSSRVEIAGWAWHGQPVNEVDISLDEGLTWQSAAVEERTGFSWQKFHLQIELEPGSHTLYARAATADGQMQPLTGRRNHCHSVRIVVSDRTSPD